MLRVTGRAHMSASQADDTYNFEAEKKKPEPSTASEERLRHEIMALATEINLAMEELKSLGAQRIRQNDIPTATDELAAIVETTETATGDILDAAERIERVGLLLPENSEAQAVRAAVTEIYQACNFQDLTGQRVRKIVDTLRAIDHRIASICASFGLDGHIQSRDGDISMASAIDVVDEGSLERGPSLPRDAMSQEDVDRMLAEL